MSENHENCCSCHSERSEESHCSCSCSCEHNHEAGKKDYIRLTVAFVLLLLSFMPFVENSTLLFYALTVASSLVAGYKVFYDAIRDIFKFDFGEHFLLLVAVVAAFIIGEGREAAAVSVFFSLGEIFESLANGKTEKSIKKLSQIKSDKANLVKPDGTFESVDATLIKEGDRIAVLPHERIPVDCIVESGESSIDTSSLTGESLPQRISVGSEILSGTINGEESFTAVALRGVNDSAASRIIEIAKNSSAVKSSSEKLITRFAKVYTPIIVLIGILIAVIPSLITGEWHKWIKSGLVFLVASCPCALVISVPLGFFSGIGLASKNGVIIKGGKYIEALAKAKIALFDKTGTLTDEKFSVVNCVKFAGFKEEEVKKYTFIAESASAHPLASALREYCKTDIGEFYGISEYSGEGTQVIADNKKILCGSKRLMNRNGIDTGDMSYAVFLSINGELAGAFEIEGNVRIDSAETVERLRKNGINKIFMLSGDRKKAAEYVSEKCGLDGFYAELMPEDKVAKLNELREKYGEAVYVGDGINDAPVLVSADVGVSMGIGSDTAIESSDIVLAKGNLTSLCDAVKISKKTMNAVYFNIVFALSVKFIVLLLALFGLSFMSLAVFTDVGVSVIAILNSSRLLALKIK